MNEHYRLSEKVCVGHVHFIVTNLERAVAFYRDILGFHVSEDMRTEPNARDVVFLTANDAEHHHVALMEMRQFQPYPSGGHAGLFHIAFQYPSQYDLALALKHIMDQGYPIDHCHDYATGEAVNLRDPDGIPLELYYGLPPETWPRVDGQIRVINRKIEAEEILQALQEEHQPR